MKNLSLITFFFILVSTRVNYGQTFAPVARIESSEYKPINRYAAPDLRSKGKKLKKIGLIVAGSGVLAIAGGVILMADAGVFSTDYFKEKKWKGATPERIAERYLGGALIDLGTYAVAGGVVVYIIGNKKTNRERAALNFTLSPVSAGVGLRF
jgi:hypothetical protein